MDTTIALGNYADSYHTLPPKQPPCAQLLSMLSEDRLKTVFQPIVSLRSGSVLGYEALTRGPAGPYEFPTALFDSAEEHGLTWEFEYLCRRLAIKRFAQTQSDRLLFLNVNPKIVEDPRFREGYTRQQLTDRHLQTCSIVFEITERASVTNYGEFCSILRHYTDQGFRIAIDDAGAGYSGLNLIANIRPQFVKVDMQLVRGIDTDLFRRNLLRFFVDFASAAGITLIAEGIETPAEARTLMELGVEFGQGYYLGRPSPELTEPPEYVREELHILSESKVAMSLRRISTAVVGDFAKAEQWLSPQTVCSTVETIFEANGDLMGVPIVDDGRPCGLVMRDKLYTRLGWRYGYSLYHSKPIERIMDTSPLTVDFHSPIERVSKLAMSRGPSHLYDYIIVTMEGSYYGVISVKDLLERTTEYEIRYAQYTQPLSGLPGNVLIEQELTQALSAQPEWSVLYVDLDNFKAYNDKYGFELGDDLIRFTARLLVGLFGGEEEGSFVGHIGGDDFVVLCRTWDVEPRVQRFLREFDEGVRCFYDDSDLEMGHISSTNRRGEAEVFPITSASVAVVWNRAREIESYRLLARLAVDLKKDCKAVTGSTWRCLTY